MEEGRHYATAGEILAADDRKRLEIDVPEWGGIIRLRELGADDREWYFAQIQPRAPKPGEEPLPLNIIGIRAKMLSRCIVDEKGEPIFDEADIKRLGAKSNTTVDRVFTAAQKLSGMDEESIKAAAKNSDAAPTSSSSTDSP